MHLADIGICSAMGVIAQYIDGDDKSDIVCKVTYD